MSDSSLRKLENSRPIYLLPMQPLVADVLVPAYRSAESASCMVGFFSSSALADLAPGLAAYLNRPGPALRLIISPYLTKEDQVALAAGVGSAGDLNDLFGDRLLITSDDLEIHTLECLAHLLKNGRIEIRIALMKNALFHPKVWIFHSGPDTVAAHGSSNLTGPGLGANYEQVSVSSSWKDESQAYVVRALSQQFQSLWDNEDSNCVTIDLPSAVRTKLLQTYGRGKPPTEQEFEQLFERAKGINRQVQDSNNNFQLHPPSFTIPAWLNYHDGPFAHQGAAVKEWIAAGYNGILEMATGSGKTVTALIAAHNLYLQARPLLIVISAPYIPLIDQWCSEVEEFGLRPRNFSDASGPTGRRRMLQHVSRLLRSEPNVEVIVVSHTTLCNPGFQDALAEISATKLLIADEVHNLGRREFIEAPPELFDYRIGLSATPVRQYDAEGTKDLMNYFGSVVFRFGLEEAIGTCLVPYDYHVHLVNLTEYEMDEYRALSARIRQNSWRMEANSPDEYLAKLLRDRRALLETAEGKIAMLGHLLSESDSKELIHTLIYATDKDPSQLESVNDLLNTRGYLFHQLTSDETRDRFRTRQILSSFQEGVLQILTAKRVLDEGVNVPEIRTAYILASTTVERQWTQRRGRLLRKCDTIGKTYSTIHDFVVLPPDGEADRDTKSMLEGELKRVQEFARLSRNTGRSDGALNAIHLLAQRAFG